MLTQLRMTEGVARMAMGSHQDEGPLPPGPNYGPFGYFRLALLVLAALVVILTIVNLW